MTSPADALINAALADRLAAAAGAWKKAASAAAKKDKPGFARSAAGIKRTQADIAPDARAGSRRSATSCRSSAAMCEERHGSGRAGVRWFTPPSRLTARRGRGKVEPAMQPRQILIVAGVAIVAFAAAFGIAGAGGGEESKAAAAGLEPAEVIEVGDATVTAGVTAGAGLPALQLPKKKKPRAGHVLERRHDHARRRRLRRRPRSDDDHARRRRRPTTTAPTTTTPSPPAAAATGRSPPAAARTEPQRSSRRASASRSW